MQNVQVHIKTHRGIAINYQRSGRYEIKLNGRYLEFDNVAQCEGMINAFAKAVQRG